MPGPRRKIDPATRDYTIATGAPTVDSTYASSVLIALSMERDSCPLYDEDEQIGSRLHTIKKLTPDAKVLARSYALEALAPLRPVLRELAVTADIKPLEVKPGRWINGLVLDVSWREGGTGAQRQGITYSPRIGG